jgi:hypothetical protein
MPPRSLRRTVGAVGLTLVVVAVAACGPPNDPQEVVRAWINAVATAEDEKVLDLTCNTELWVANAVNLGTLVAQVVEILGPAEGGIDWPGAGWIDHIVLGQVVKVDVSNLRYELASQQVNEAAVRIHGRLLARLRGRTFAIHVDRTHRVVLEDGLWRWCGLAESTIAVGSE